MWFWETTYSTRDILQYLSLIWYCTILIKCSVMCHGCLWIGPKCRFIMHHAWCWAQVLSSSFAILWWFVKWNFQRSICKIGNWYIILSSWWLLHIMSTVVISVAVLRTGAQWWTELGFCSVTHRWYQWSLNRWTDSSNASCVMYTQSCSNRQQPFPNPGKGCLYLWPIFWPRNEVCSFDNVQKNSELMIDGCAILRKEYCAFVFKR